uniref:Uncharacterized protein n=1 Tax=candidate division CPR3 bacterium TaxID=2268181 RepID=A0A7C4QXH7_UNCC3
MNKKILIVSGALIIFSIVLYILSNVMFNTEKIQQNNQQPINENDTEVELSTESMIFPLDMDTSNELIEQSKKMFDLALGKSREWRSDSSPVAVLVQYTDSIKKENGKNTFIFISPSLPQFYFVFEASQRDDSFSEISYKRSIQFREDYFLREDVVVMPMKYWVLSFIEALKKADDLGGKEVRVKNNKYDVNMLLSKREGGFLNWEVEYLVDGLRNFSSTIDAYKGEVQ